MAVRHLSLLDQPESLKEFIDWMLRLSGNDAHGGGDGANGIQGLGEAVNALLKKDNVEIPAVERFDKWLKGNGSGYGSAKSCLSMLSGGLEKFIGFEGVAPFPSGSARTIAQNKIGRQGTYNSVYDSKTNWSKDVSSVTSRQTCARIFLTFMPRLFSSLTHLYWRCKCGGWYYETISEGYNLRRYMEGMGFEYWMLNTCMTGGNIALILEAAFPEFSKVTKERPSLFYSELCDGLRQQTNKESLVEPNATTGYPLTQCFIIADTYIEATSSSFFYPGAFVLLVTFGGCYFAYKRNLGGFATNVDSTFRKVQEILSE
ncbi:variant erythrocyte surface antigen-1 family protein [Babesia caballi]|uniref:Variant erythrocyte surface antigen-1 family protein n=1 Tax=Babesia caballi TaxID=5871 RepID=A0AAV4M2F1_BABCB|nr:variant erythrocyte surface antigen-1 family protein [Babesia caballi]